MTSLTSPSQAKRSGSPFLISWAEYLDKAKIVTIDPSIKAVCMKLDEEGNEYLEMSKEEASQLIARLEQAIKSLT